MLAQHPGNQWKRGAEGWTDRGERGGRGRQFKLHLCQACIAFADTSTLSFIWVDNIGRISKIIEKNEQNYLDMGI